MTQPHISLASAQHACPCTLAQETLDGLEAFQAGKTRRTYTAGELVFSEGGQSLGIYCIEQGRVKLTKYTPDGKCYITRIAKAGDLLGYRGLFGRDVYPVNAEAVDTSVLRLLEREQIIKALQQHPQLALKFCELLGNELREAEDLSCDLAYKPVSERCADLLLALQADYGRPLPKGQIRLEMGLSREELASLLGTTSETVTRQLMRFQEQKIIRLVKRTIVLQSPERLAAYDFEA